MRAIVMTMVVILVTISMMILLFRLPIGMGGCRCMVIFKDPQKKQARQML